MSCAPRRGARRRGTRTLARGPRAPRCRVAWRETAVPGRRRAGRRARHRRLVLAMRATARREEAASAAAILDGSLCAGADGVRRVRVSSHAGATPRAGVAAGVADVLEDHQAGGVPVVCADAEQADDGAGFWRSRFRVCVRDLMGRKDAGHARRWHESDSSVVFTVHVRTFLRATTRGRFPLGSSRRRHTRWRLCKIS